MPSESIDPTTLYPCLALVGDLDVLDPGSYVAWDFGDGLVTLLVRETEQGYEHVSVKAVGDLGMDGEALWEVALGNLTIAIQTGAFEFGVGELGPGQQIVIVQDHWLASSLASHGGVYALASEHLGASELRVAVPSRDAMVIFRADLDASLRHLVSRIIDELMAESTHPFGHRVFEFTESGAVEGSEGDALAVGTPGRPSSATAAEEMSGTTPANSGESASVEAATDDASAGAPANPSSKDVEVIVEMVDAIGYLATEMDDLGESASESFSYVKEVVGEGRVALAGIGMDDVATDALDRAYALLSGRDVEGARVTLDNLIEQLNRATASPQEP